MCDLLIKNGTVVDGTGAPRFVADVAVKDGQIAAVGPNLSLAAKETVDATGKIVTPGFIDIHTHYDGQITWDPLCTPSCNHGVTTVAFGNCGVGFAPVRPGDESKLIDILESVEDIPGTALHEGIKWSWETFPQYLDTLGKVNAAMDFASYMGHVPLRQYVMGDRVFEKPTPEDLDKMRQLAKDAVSAGAFGVSSSRTLLHRDNTGNVLPGSYADRDELASIIKGMAQGGGGMFEMASDFADEETEFTWVGKLSKAFGVPISFGFGGGQKQIKLLEEANEISPGMITGQVAVKLQGSLQSLDATWHPFVAHPTYLKELKHLPVEERRMRMRDPMMKKQILSEKSLFGDAPFARSTFSPSFLFLMGNPAKGDVSDYEQNPETNSILKLAEARGEDPMNLIYDALVDGQTIWKPVSPFTNGKGGDAGPQRSQKRLIEHPNTVVGLGDGGAHLTMLQEAGCPTFMLTHWARDRTAGPKIELEQAVMFQTSRPAGVMGLEDRGVIAPGMRADLNVIDYENLTLHTPQVANDLPTGAKRWLQEADGYDLTMCKGEVTFRKGQPTGALPGRLLRGPLKKHLNVIDADLDFDAEGIPHPKSTADAKYIGADGSNLTVDKAMYVEDKDLVGGMSALARAKRAHENAGSVTDIQNRLKQITANNVESRSKL